MIHVTTESVPLPALGPWGEALTVPYSAKVPVLGLTEALLRAQGLVQCWTQRAQGICANE